MATCLGCGAPATMALLATSEGIPHPSEPRTIYHFTETVFACATCRVRGVLKAKLPAGHLWSLGAEQPIVACPSCGAQTAGSRLWSCPECGTAACHGCMAHHHETGTCGDCAGDVEREAHAAAAELGLPDQERSHKAAAVARYGLDALAAKHGGDR